MENNQQDFIATELLRELKEENARKDKQIKRLQSILVSLVLAAFVSLLAVTSLFVYYLNQYDFTSSQTVEQYAEGFYALVDSEGNTVAWDITQEELQDMMEVVGHGEG